MRLCSCFSVLWFAFIYCFLNCFLKSNETIYFSVYSCFIYFIVLVLLVYVQHFVAIVVVFKVLYK